jgi:hypothetical protein
MSRTLSPLFAAALLGLCLAEAAAAESTALAGDYRMQGRGFGPDDSAYQGTCSLRGDGPAYEVSCFNADTRHTYVGRGLAAGDTLAIFIGDVLRGDHRVVFAGEYLVLYQRKPDGTLEGIWIDGQGGATGGETLTPIR